MVIELSERRRLNKILCFNSSPDSRYCLIETGCSDLAKIPALCTEVMGYPDSTSKAEVMGPSTFEVAESELAGDPADSSVFPPAGIRKTNFSRLEFSSRILRTSQNSRASEAQRILRGIRLDLQPVGQRGPSLQRRYLEGWPPPDWRLAILRIQPGHQPKLASPD